MPTSLGLITLLMGFIAKYKASSFKAGGSHVYFQENM